MNIFENLRKITRPYGDDEYDDEYENDEAEDFDDEPVRPSEPARRNEYTSISKPDSRPNGSVISMGTPKVNKPEVVLFRPNTFKDATKAADDLRNKKAVIVNLEQVDKALNRRITDFLFGCAYVLDAKVNPIANNTFLLCPYNMDVVGSLDNAQGDNEG